MNERFTKLFSLPENAYTLGAPLLIAAGAILRDNLSDTVLAQLKLKNLDGRTVRAVRVRLWTRNALGHAAEQPVDYTYLDLFAERGGEFGSKNPIPLSDATTRSFRAEIVEAAFEDGSTWNAPEGAVWENLPAGQSLEAALGDPGLVRELRLRRGEDCRFVPARWGDLWRCACGELVRGESCPACGRGFFEIDLATLTASRDERAALELAAAQKAAEEQAAAAEMARLNAEKKAEEAKKRAASAKKRRRGIIISIAAVLALFISYLAASPFIAKSLAASGNCGTARKLLIIPAVADLLEPNLNPYLLADGSYEAGDYIDAANRFTELGEYLDAEERALESRYENAKRLYANKDYDAAIQAFDALQKKNYRDSADLWIACRLDRVSEYTKEGEYDKAYKELSALKGKVDSKRLDSEKSAVNVAAYARAENYYDRKDYSKAGELFLLIKQYNYSYRDTNQYISLTALWLIADYWNERTSVSPDTWVWEAAPDSKAEAIALLGFKDAKAAIMASDYVSFDFLLGNWSGGGFKFNVVLQDGTHWVYYNVPYGNLLNGQDHIGFTDGYYVGYKNGHRNQATRVYEITIVDENTLRVRSLANGVTYTMTRG